MMSWARSDRRCAMPIPPRASGAPTNSTGRRSTATACGLPSIPQAVLEWDGKVLKGLCVGNDIDLHLGRRLRRRRRLLGLTQQQLAASVGVRFQQIQKYECGANRISAARLWRIAAALEVPVGYFYEGLAGAAASLPAARLPLDDASDLARTYQQLGERRRQRLLENKPLRRAD